MTDTPDDHKPLAYDAYQTLADRYAALVDTKPHNAYYERPATLSLLPDVDGKHVLDAGCGPGLYAQIMLARGASVVALDASPAMLAQARARLAQDPHADRVTFYQALLEEPLDFLADDIFDLALATLVLDYVQDLGPVFAEFARVLKPGGLLVFSMDNPAATPYYYEIDDYFQVERVEDVWRGFGGEPVTVPRYRRALGDLLNPLIEASFVLERVLEPRPTAAFQAADPEYYDRLITKPGFLCIRARRAKTADARTP